jgi:hypothetical protein
LDAAITERTSGQSLEQSQHGHEEGVEEAAAKVIAFLGKDENGEAVQVAYLIFSFFLVGTGILKTSKLIFYFFIVYKNGHSV